MADDRREIPLALGVLLPDAYRRQIEPSIQLALKHVHNDPDMIPDFCLYLIYKDTQVLIDA